MFMLDAVAVVRLDDDEVVIDAFCGTPTLLLSAAVVTAVLGPA